MRIKTVFNEDIRVHAFSSEDDVTIDALSGVISKSYKIVRPFSLTYEDSDGDVVTIQSNEDLKVALEDAQKVLKVHVKKEVSNESAVKSKEVAVESDDEEETEFEIEEKTTTSPVVDADEDDTNENEDNDAEGENVYEVYCDDLLDNEELQKEITDTIKFALGRLRQGDNIQIAVESALAAHEMVSNHPLVQKALPKLPTFAVKAQMWVPIAVNIQDAQVDMFFQMILAKLRALRDGPSDYPDFSFLQRHPLFGHIFSQFDAYTERGENGAIDVHVKAQQKEIVHPRIACDGCDAEPINGVRYKCAVCPDFDLCEPCEQQNKHDPTHPMIKMNVSLQDFHGRPAGLREFLRRVGHGGRRCGRGGFGRNRGGRCGRGGFPRGWILQQKVAQDMAQQLLNQIQQTPLNPNAQPYNPADLLERIQSDFGRCGRGRGKGGRGRGKKCGGRKGGKCGKQGKEGKKECKGKKHWRQEKKKAGKEPLDYDAKLIRHMNLEDDTPVGSGMLIKTWRVKNIGLKTWNKGDVAVIYDGKPFHHLVDGARFDVAGPVENGQEVDISVVLNVPEGFSGDSLVKYRLKCGDIKFGPPLKVKIRVVGDQISEVQKIRKCHGGKKGNEHKILKAEKQLERIEQQRNKLEQRAEMINARIEKFQQQKEKKDEEQNEETQTQTQQQTETVVEMNEIEEEEEMKDEPPATEPEEPEEVHSSSSFEVVDEEESEASDGNVEQQEGYSFHDFSDGWSKRHLRKTSTESIKRAFLGLKPNEDGVVEANVVEKFFDEFTRLSKPLQKEGSSEVESDTILVEEEEISAPEAAVEKEENDDEPILEEIEKPKEKKEFIEPKEFPYQMQVEQLTAMGFNEDLVKNMLERNGGNVQAVLNEILG